MNKTRSTDCSKKFPISANLIPLMHYCSVVLGVFIQGEDRMEKDGLKRMNQIFLFDLRHVVFTVEQKLLVKKF